MTVAEPGRRVSRAGSAGWWACRAVLAVALCWAGTAKLLAPPQAFADAVASFRLLPVSLVSPAALSLPPLEILVGAALLARRPRRLGAFGALALTSIFLLALLAAAARGIPVDCGCFGSGPPALPLGRVGRLWLDLARDAALALAALALYRHELGQAVTRARLP